MATLRGKLDCAVCKRQQSLAPAEESGGITVTEAESVGWMTDGKSWWCPCCASPRLLIKRAQKAVPEDVPDARFAYGAPWTEECQRKADEQERERQWAASDGDPNNHKCGIFG